MHTSRSLFVLHTIVETFWNWKHTRYGKSFEQPNETAARNLPDLD